MNRTPYTVLTLVLACCFSVGALAATVEIRNLNSPGEGFNDPTPVSPVGGNPKVTVGEQRLYAFRKAADYWADKINNDITIVIEAEMVPLDCSATSGTLGAAGPAIIFANYSGTPKVDTWYHSALAGALAGGKLRSDLPDIQARFNSNLDNNDDCLRNVNWYYGVDGKTPEFGSISFFDVVLHEFGHGLGFSTFVDLATGQHASDGNGNAFPDVFETFLEDHELGRTWPALTQAQRKYSATNLGNVHWVGQNVVEASHLLRAGVTGGHVRMYAPAKLEEGSSISHWDSILFPNELMEPDDTGDAVNLVTDYLLRDLGWDIAIGDPYAGQPPPNVYCNTTAISIPDNRPNGALSFIDIDNDGMARDISVSVQIEHQFVDDLTVTLSHGENSSSVLIDGGVRQQECGQANVDAVFWDGAPEAANNLCSAAPTAAVAGTVHPVEPLGVFDGLGLAGQWVLRVSDRKQLDTGKLLNWCIMPISHGVCDGRNVSLTGAKVLDGEVLVCNAGQFTGDNTIVYANGQLDINYSGKVVIKSMRVFKGGRLRIRHQAPPGANAAP